ncbi:hypothetical protein LX64_02527 [Chitinophaga skermanii]|uniref:Uncharacterized protein n=1 Tax=Chitinophaga skermanii TaxID=331697 RepID=A0A327QM11_9BACT|nr:hypothetical protein LX64_02527 [Chitinophaga skermanii]
MCRTSLKVVIGPYNKRYKYLIYQLNADLDKEIGIFVLLGYRMIKTHFAFTITYCKFAPQLVIAARRAVVLKGNSV